MSKRFSISGMKSVFGKVLPALLVAVGAFSGTADAACSGTLYFKAPPEWGSDVYVAFEQMSTKLTEKEGEYYTIELSNLNNKSWGKSSIGLMNYTDVFGSGLMVTATKYNTTGQIGENGGIACPGYGKKLYVQEDPMVAGGTYHEETPPNASYLYVLVPDDKEWQSDNMMVSNNGGAGKQMSPAPGMCGWFRMVYGADEVPDEILIYRASDPEEKIGYEGYAGASENPTALPFKALLENYGTKALYFIPDDSQWPEGKEDVHGLFVTDPGVDGVCSFELAAVIYDTDESLWTSKYGHIFSTNEQDDGYAGQCLGVRTGIVQTDLGANGKPQLNTTAGGNGIKCFGSADNFNKLFNYVEGLNEVQCYDMPFRHYGSDPRWAFDSDSATMAGNFGGFHPVDNTTDATVVKEVSPVACPTCRTKRYAQGPVPFKISADDFDHYCNGPGWFGGIDCGAIASGNLTYFGNGDNPGVWDWGASRWEGQHNQQFCFESHAKFTYREDQEFTFRGDDDIWVFINKKLAVDNGGTHLAAPSHVVLKNLNTTYGPNFLVPGSEYSLDIFFCDRRTTMSNVIIKTNMFIKQTSGLSTTSTPNSDGSVNYSICYDKSGGSSCASVAGVQTANGQKEEKVHACGDSIAKYGSLRYRIVTRAGEEKATLTAGQSGMQMGGFDLSNKFSPKVYPDKINKLSPGSYRLVIEFCDKQGKCEDKSKTYINFRIKGNLDIMTKTSTYTVNKGDSSSTYYKSGTKWTFVDKGLAGTRVPVYVSAFADGEVDLLGAVGQSYTLTLSAGMNAYASQTDTTKLNLSQSRTVGVTGIDTIWIEQTVGGMTSKQEKKDVSLKTKATITFYVPELHFATPVDIDSLGKVLSWKHPIAGDPDTADGDEYFHWIGSDVDMYVLVINPITNDICRDCNIALAQYDGSSGVLVTGVSPLIDGFSIISVRSSKEYTEDSTAYITLVAADDANLLTAASYINMRFREPPVPYPQLVDIFDAHGKSQGDLSIVEPYYSPSKEYLDGRADSIAIYYHRAFQPNEKGDYKDSLPDHICLNWDEEHVTTRNYFKDSLSTASKDSAVQCSYTFSKDEILAAHKARKADNVLSFVVKDTAFSEHIKTAGSGKLLSFATFVYGSKKRLNKVHFDRNTTERIAPVIVAARVDNVSDQLSRLTVTLSEPVRMLIDTYKNAPFSFYVNSAKDLSKEKRYVNTTANAAPNGLGSDKLVMVFDKSQGDKNPAPRLGDYIRFRADALIWGDTTDITSTDIARVAADSGKNWNSPTNYDVSPRTPSPWFTVVGDYSVEVSAVKFATMNKEIDPNTTPISEAFVVPTSYGKEEIEKMYPNTLGFIVMSDISSFVNRDPRIEEYFNDPKNEAEWEEVYFQYEVKYFTNLGGYVAGDKQKIYCLDKVNKAKFNKEYFGGKDCRTNQGNFYIAWNMLSDKKRLVGTGAYIAKLTSFVKLGSKGKAKGSKAEETDMWGAKRGKGIIKK